MYPAHRLVVSQHVEVPDRSTTRQVAVQRPGDVNLASVRVDDESSVVGELAGHCVRHSRPPVQVRVSSANLYNNTVKPIVSLHRISIS